MIVSSDKKVEIRFVNLKLEPQEAQDLMRLISHAQAWYQLNSRWGAPYKNSFAMSLLTEIEKQFRP